MLFKDHDVVIGGAMRTEPKLPIAEFGLNQSRETREPHALVHASEHRSE